MAIPLERVHLLLQVAVLGAQFPKLNGISGLAGDELEEANEEALKSLNEKRKKQEEERQKKIAELRAAEEKKSKAESDDDEPAHATAGARRI
jgi:hypothetical protein